MTAAAQQSRLALTCPQAAHLQLLDTCAAFDERAAASDFTLNVTAGDWSIDPEVMIQLRALRLVQSRNLYRFDRRANFHWLTDAGYVAARELRR